MVTLNLFILLLPETLPQTSKTVYAVQVVLNNAVHKQFAFFDEVKMTQVLSDYSKHLDHSSQSFHYIRSNIEKGSRDCNKK